ncbi:ATP-binding protein [Streptomyces sp. G5(2025)]|uniref:ATP-binding protein n=1 Tax=Streptomyces sp. G5(2025) TaxID=3406628 RepID=UPI003C1AF3BD
MDLWRGGAMDQVTALELTAALTLAAARPGARRALLDTVSASADAATADLFRAWASAQQTEATGETHRALGAALAQQAAHRPELARELRHWITATLGPGALAPAPADVANSIDGTARIQGAAIQAHGIHGGVHIHPAAPAPAAPGGLGIPRQLHPVPDHFTNRVRELAELDLRAAEARTAPVIAVISGPAGVGKTTLARRWLLGLADAFPDGQLYADLRGHSEGGPARPGELLGQFLRALGQERIPADLGEQAALWRSATAGRRVVVLLDNALSAAQVRPLLPGGARALTAVTSRGRLSGLGMDGATFHPLDVLGTGDAVELLRRRIGADRVTREPEAALAVAEACAGLPLAVCVAAARVASRPRQPLAAMAGALGGGAGGALDVLRVEGEYAVRAALDASYRLLSPELACGYRRLGLAPVPLLGVEAAAAACDLSTREADQLLDELAEVNLLEDLGPEPRTGTGRYRFHDLVRAHAGQLAAEHEGSAGSGAAVRRVVDFYLYAATEAETLLTPSHRILPRGYAHRPAPPPPFADAHGALAWLDAERAHLMAALRTAAEHGWHDTAWMLTDAMWPLFLRLRPYELWVEAHETGLAAARRAGNREAESQMLTSGGAGLRNAGRPDAAVGWFGQALEVARERVAAAREEVVVAGEGAAAPREGVAVAGEEVAALREGAAVAREEVVVAGEGVAVAREEVAAPREGVAVAGEEVAAPREGAAVAREEVVVAGEGVAAPREEVAAARERVAAAREEVVVAGEGAAAPREGAAVAGEEAAASREGAAVAREGVGSVRETHPGRQGPGTGGPDVLTAARRAEAQALHGLGQSHRLAGRLPEALRCFRLALPLREAIGYARGAALTRICLGDVALADGRPEEALPELAAARAALMAEGDLYDAARALAFLGQAALRCAGDDAAAVEAAEAQLTKALGEFESAGSVHWQGRVLEMLGEAAEDRRETERARAWYDRSLARYRSVSAPDVRRLEGRLNGLG